MVVAQSLVTKKEKTEIDRNVWFARPRPAPQARLRLFCFPYSGASAQIFNSWADILPTDIEVCPVQLPGRVPRFAESPFTRLAPLVRATGQAIVPYLDKPFAFFGHSMGALLSFELARRLRADYGIGPVHLYVSGHRAPQILNHESPIHELPEPEFVAELCQLNGMPQEVLENAELMQLLIPILRADFAMCETYAYEAQEPLNSPIFAFGGLQDEHVSREDLAAWREQTSDSFTLRMFPGDHFYLITNRQLLMQTIARGLVNSYA